MVAYVTSSAKETQALAKKLAKKLKPKDILLFFADLGAGKTTFIQGLAEGLNLKHKATSPSFIIVNEYPGKIPLFHIDLYRLEDEKSIEDLGIEEYYEKGGIVAIEWAERLGKNLPPKARKIKIETLSENKRKITI